MPRWYEPIMSRATAPLVGMMLALMIGATACGPATDDGDAGADRAGSDAATDGPRTGTLRLGDHTYSFVFRECDPEGTDPDYVTLGGSGTTPDGRRLRVQLERRPGETPGAWRDQDVFVLIGDIRDGESWGAKRHTGPDGGWYVGELGSEPAPGPLIEVEGRAISVDATLRSGESEEERPAEIRAECPA